MLPELSFSDCWSRGTKLWERDCHGRKTQLVVSNQAVTNSCCGLPVIFCGFILLLIGPETINISEIFFGVHGFTGMIVNGLWKI